jgi:hypothetical protein
MQITNSLSRITLLSAAILLSGATVLSAHEKPRFIKEGKWRGEFTVSESKVPFNFELKGKDAEHAISH